MFIPASVRATLRCFTFQRHTIHVALGELCTSHLTPIKWSLYSKAPNCHFLQSNEVLVDLYTVHALSSLSCTVPMQPTATVTIPIATDINCNGNTSTHIHTYICGYVDTYYVRQYCVTFICASVPLKRCNSYVRAYVHMYVRIYQLCALGGVFPSLPLGSGSCPYSIVYICTYVRTYVCVSSVVCSTVVRGT